MLQCYVNFLMLVIWYPVITQKMKDAGGNKRRRGGDEGEGDMSKYLNQNKGKSGGKGKSRGRGKPGNKGKPTKKRRR